MKKISLFLMAMMVSVVSAFAQSNLITNGDFATPGALASGYTDRYAVGEPWVSNVTFGNIRVMASTAATSGGNVLVWRGSGNSNYISQPVTVQAKKVYKVTIKQVASGNANADFNVGIGSAAGQIDIASTTVRLGTNNDGEKTVYLTTPASVTGSTFFTFSNTSNNTASSGSDPVAQIDYFTMELDGDAQEGLAGDYVIKHAQSGRFLNGSNNWGTKASVTQHGQFMTVALNNGKYSIDSHYSNGSGKNFLAAGDNTYVDAAVVYHEIEAIEGGYSIKDSNGKFFTSDGNVANFNGESAQTWQFISKDDYIANAIATAKAGTPADLTALVPDANFSRNSADFSKWEGESKMTKGGPNDALGATATGMNVERWGGNSTSIDFHTTINGLPNGKYRIKFQSIYRYNNTTANTNDVAAATHADGTEKIIVTFSANEASVPFISIADEKAYAAYGKMPFTQVEASEAFSKGCYQNQVEVEVTEGTLTLKVTKNEADHEGCDWTILDNIELYLVELAKGEDPLLTMSKEKAIANLPTAIEGSIFTPTVSDVNAAKSAIMAATSLDEVEKIVEGLVFPIPALSGEWKIRNANAALYLGEAVLSADALSTTFEKATDGFYMKVDGKYINMKGGNTWSMSADATAKTAWKFNLSDGKYSIQGPNGLVGVDNLTEGQSVFGNKAVANNGLWVIDILQKETSWDFTSVSNNGVQGDVNNTVEASESGVMYQFEVAATGMALSKGTAKPTLALEGNSSVDFGAANIIAYEAETAYVRFMTLQQQFFTQKGIYVLTIPEGTFVNAKGVPNAETIMKWEVAGADPVPFDLTSVVMNWKGEEYAAGSEVEALSYMYTIATDKTIAAGEGHIEFKDAEGNGIGVGSLNADAKTISFMSFGQDGYTTPGVYTLTIPAGAIVDAEGNPCNELTATWTVKEAGEKVINITDVTVSNDPYTVTLKFNVPAEVVAVADAELHLTLNGEEVPSMKMAAGTSVKDGVATVIFTDAAKDPEHRLQPGTYVAFTEMQLENAENKVIENLIAKYIGSIVLEEFDAEDTIIVITDENGVVTRIKVTPDVKIEWKKGSDL